MLQLICLIIGIVGFVKGKVNVTKRKELRGKGLYIVCTLFCLPLPLSFLAGVVLGAIEVSGGQSASDSRVAAIAGVLSIIPILAGIVLAFVLATPKAEDPQIRGFEVQMPPPPPSDK